MLVTFTLDVGCSNLDSCHR